MNVFRTIFPAPAIILASLVSMPLIAAAQSPGTILHAPEAAKLLPDSVYYAGKSASTQLRNSAGIRFSDDHYVLAVLVDTSGYSSAVQEKYQGYLLTEVPLEFSDHSLPAGAYGVGFVGDHFVVTDIGTHEIFQTHATRDDHMQRPLPLQILESATPGMDRLCLGRTCVDFGRAK
jgi:hypothetical protein